MTLLHLRAFAQCRRANIAVTFALALPVLVAGTGIAIDMSRLYAADLNVQKSLDAAALAAAKEFGKTQDPVALTKIAEAYFYLNAGQDASLKTVFRFDGVTTVNGNAVMKVSATRNVPMTFGAALMSMFGGADKRSYDLNKASEIVVQNRSIEMALVLDNSGSMSSPPASGGTAKITTLKNATTDLVNQMMAATDANVQYPVSVSVVPFSGAVNVGKDYASASWMDTKGVSPEHHDDLDWSNWRSGLEVALPALDFYGNSYVMRSITLLPLTRFYLFDKVGKSWGGCVMSRPNGYAVTDDAPNARNPSTLFVPTFAPSEVYWTGTGDSLRNTWIGSDNIKSSSDLAAIKKQRDASRYMTGSAASNTGPNFVCNTQPLTTLSKSKADVLNSVKGMIASGGTNIMEGLAWGWRTLSANEPFTQGRPAKTEDNLKIIVLMTDGENTYNASYANGDQVEMANPGHSLYGTYGYAQILQNDPKLPNYNQLRPGRMFDSVKTTTKRADIDSVTAAMNENMSTVCENIKADGRNDDGSDGIVVFTIAFDLKDGSPVKERLRKCASSGVNGNGAKLYYDAKNAADLTAAFSSITEEISSLRIAR